MFPFSMFGKQQLAQRSKRQAPTPRPKAHFRPCLETLEDRFAPATFTVNTLADTVDVNTPVTSLRDAITAANSQAGHNIINFSVSGTINLTGSLPDISSNIQILGPGAASLTLRRDTGGDYRIFTVVGGPTVVVDGLTISNGFTNGGAFTGGGISNDGTLTVSNCTLSGNSANITGGGISNGGTLTVSNCALSGNSANGGGGIYNQGTLTVSNSTLSGNSANSAYGGYGGYGGGIWNAATLTVSNSTLSGNSANIGGGITNFQGTLMVSNSILSGNVAYSRPGPYFDLGYGGGIYNSAALTVSNSTLSGNSADAGGGGIYNDAPPFANGLGTLVLNNTSVANNTSGGDIANFGTVTLFGSNVGNITTYSGGTVVDPAAEIDNLIAQVSTLDLTPDQKAGLTNKLQAAGQAIAASQFTPAINQLGAFINQMNAFVKARKLTTAQDQPLTTDANDIIAVLLAAQV